MVIKRTAKDTLTAVEMDVGDELEFTLASGQTRRIVLKHTGAHVTYSDLPEPKVEKAGCVTNYRFGCKIEIDGAEVNMLREVANEKSFYEPREIMGLRIWLDAVADIFDILTENHGACRPKKKARFAIQDASTRICPTLLHPWCPLPEGGLRIGDCYNGEDCWMGAYFGAAAHGGLDINHPAGTPIWTPIAFEDQYLFNSLAAGDNNNRWRGIHTWPNGAKWILQVHHVIRVLAEEHTPVPAGFRIADGAGVLCGSHEHSHFVFKIEDHGEEILLDPWILFWQMYRDRELTQA